MTLSNSLLSSAVTTVIIVIVFGGGEGTVISYSTDIGTVVDILFRGMLGTAYAVHGILSLTATDSIDDTYMGTNLDRGEGIATFESGDRTYVAVVAGGNSGVQILDVTDPYDITAAGSIGNTVNLNLNGVNSIAIFESGGSTYAAVTSYFDGVQILDIIDPYDITAADSIIDNDSLALGGASGITTFESGGRTYAVVTAYGEGVQILDISDPYDILAAGSIIDNDSLALRGASGITTFESGGNTYAAVIAFADDGVQILNITDPYDITAAGSIDHTELALTSPSHIATFESGANTYAAVTTTRSGGYFHILNVTDPYEITAAGSIIDNGSLKLDDPLHFTIFNSSGYTYAAVAASDDHGVQILNITDPDEITAAGSIDDINLILGAPGAIATFESGGNIYAAVTARIIGKQGVQMLDITDPDDITAADSIRHQSDTVLSIANGIATFKSGNHTYAAVTSSRENGVQMLDITDPYDITLTGSITDNGNLTTLRGALGITTFKSGDNTYAAVASPDDDGVQILDVTDPYDIIPTDSITDAEVSYFTLDGASGITTFKSGSHTYVAVTAADEKGFDILNVTDPYDITDITGILDPSGKSFSNARGITTFKSGNNTYVAVTSHDINHVRILDITRINRITPIGGITDNDSLTLKGARGITTFESGNSTYVAVAARGDHGIQILNVTDPFHIIAAGSIDDADDTDLELYGANDIATFESDGNIYAAVASINDDGIQILNITDPYNIIPIGSITDDSNMKLKGAHSITTFKSGGYTHVAVAGRADNGVQIIRIGIGDDTTPPKITILGDNPTAIFVDDSYDDSDITCTDHVDPSPTLTSDIVVDTSQAGEYTVTYSCADASENMADQVTRTVIVQPIPDTARPTIVILGNNPTTITVDTSYVDDRATCSDAGDDITTRIIFVTTVDTTMAGTYAVAYSCADVSGNQTIELRTVIVQSISGTPPDTPSPDTTPPKIIILGNNPVMITVGTSYDDDDGAFCFDEVDGILEPESTSNVDVDVAGQYTVTYSCADASENMADQVTRTVIVQPIPDTARPTIVILGNNPTTITVDTSYVDDRATCSDAGDDITTRIIFVTTVDTTMAGTYAVAYSCADVSGNQTIELRTVIVQSISGTPPDTPSPDTTPPKIIILGNNPVMITVGTSYDDDDGAFCFDEVDGILEPESTSNVDVDVAGQYTVTYSCADASENMADQVTRTVIVQPIPDTARPTIVILGNNPTTITVDTSYVDDRATCSDAGDDITTRIIFVTTVDTTMAGTYAVAYSCADVSGNQTIELRTVIVQSISGTPPDTPSPDTTPPKIIILGNNPVMITVGTSYDDDDGAFCFDGVDGILEPESTSNVDVDVAGQYTVTYSCADASENMADQVTRTVTVQPIPDTPPPVISDTDSSSQRRSNTQNYLIVDSNITIDGHGYGVGSGTIIKPHNIMTGQTTDIVFTAYSASDIIHFTVYLNLHGKDIGQSDSDTYISYDHGTVQIHDPHGFISDASITITENVEQSIQNTIITLVEFDGEMGLTNMVVHIWNEDRRSELIKVFDALDITSGIEMLPDPEPQILPDPEPQILPDPEPQILPDPEPQNYNGTVGTTSPDTDSSDPDTLSIIRIWAGFEHGSVTDDEMLQALNLDYQGAHIPNWVMTDLAVLVSKGSLTTDEFVTALAYVLENV